MEFNEKRRGCGVEKKKLTPSSPDTKLHSFNSKNRKCRFSDINSGGKVSFTILFVCLIQALDSFVSSVRVEARDGLILRYFTHLKSCLSCDKLLFTSTDQKAALGGKEIDLKQHAGKV